MTNFNIEGVTTLPEKEKIKIINKIWDSIEDTPPNSYTDDEINIILKERLKAIKEKTVKIDTWDNVKKRLLTKANARLKSSKNV